jgi:hypothetical protein
MLEASDYGGNIEDRNALGTPLHALYLAEGLKGPRNPSAPNFLI